MISDDGQIVIARASSLSFTGVFEYHSTENKLGAEFPEPLWRLFDEEDVYREMLGHVPAPNILRITVGIEQLATPAVESFGEPNALRNSAIRLFADVLGAFEPDERAGIWDDVLGALRR